MSIETIDSGARRARKFYRCGMCSAAIKPGDAHSASVNTYEGHAYTWRECLWCQQDRICSEVHAWSGGYNDGGVDYQHAVEWAEETIRHDSHGGVRMLARRWLARAAGGEGE